MALGEENGGIGATMLVSPTGGNFNAGYAPAPYAYPAPVFYGGNMGGGGNGMGFGGDWSGLITLFLLFGLFGGGFGGGFDGDFGTITLGALLAFQFEHDLDVDGLCGPATKAALTA